MVHGLTVPGAIEVAQRKKGFTKGLFEWLRKAPWSNPVFSGMFMSLLGFGFLGGISGVIMGTEQLNLIIHNTIYVPGHFHATVVVGTTLAFMAVTYFVIPGDVPARADVSEDGAVAALRVRPRHVRVRAVHDGRRNARRAATALGHHLRRQSARLRVPGHRAPDDGADGDRRAPGGGRRRRSTCWSWCTRCFSARRSKRRASSGCGRGWLCATGRSRSRPRSPAMAAASAPPGRARPGTFVLAMVFLTSFVLYYFVNWKYLSTVWPLDE